MHVLGVLFAKFQLYFGLVRIWIVFSLKKACMTNIMVFRVTLKKKKKNKTKQKV